MVRGLTSICVVLLLFEVAIAQEALNPVLDPEHVADPDAKWGYRLGTNSSLTIPAV